MHHNSPSLLDIFFTFQMQDPPEVLKANNVANFPFDVPETAQPVTKSFQIDGTTSGPKTISVL
jgi:hypothetical protein